jgi:trehalose/maltose hydrolase-like predicted phosphorylase
MNAGPAGCSVEAILLDWEAVALHPGPIVEGLCAAGVHVFVLGGPDVEAVDRELAARPDGPGRLHLLPDPGSDVFEVGPAGPVPTCGPAATDDGIGARWAVSWLAGRGVTGSLVLVCSAGPDRHRWTGVPGLERSVTVPVGADAGSLAAVLGEQLRRRRDRRVPHIDEDPAWTVRLPDAPAFERAAEALGTLSNGSAATRGSREEGGTGAAPLFTVNGVYTTAEVPELLPGPPWISLALGSDGPDRRVLDLRTGMLARTTAGPARLRTLRFVSAARPEALAMRAEAEASSRPDADEPGGGVRVATTGADGGGGIAVASRDRHGRSGGRRVVERLASWVADPVRSPDGSLARRQLDALDALGFDRLAAEHREAWARRWADANVEIGGDPELDLAARFAIFHLLSAAPDTGEAAVGARALTGPAYGGHVFWDADVYVLPALAAVRPAAARAMLEYRVRRLPAARAAARERGRRGARFPWESARDGADVTPHHIRAANGAVIEVRTGQHEEHIVADVAWAACEYVAWTGDRAFLRGPGRDLVVDTARYWASRVRVDGDGRGHICGVMGPDEYHPVVDDNAFTNGMARWNLRQAARLVDETGGDPAEAVRWRRLADALVDGWDPERGIHEQFDGYWELEPLLVAPIAEPPAPVDLLLGVGRVRGSQLVKQPDVLMLHHLLPVEARTGSLAAALDFYGPRTAHGSSLSPAVHAALLARAGRPDEALDLFRLAARLDLDDLTGTTAGGLHLATMGGVWQALAYGFLGLRPGADALDVDPVLPSSWTSLTVPVHVNGHRVRVHAEPGAVSLTCEVPLSVRVAGGPPVVCPPPGRTFPLSPRSRP